MNEEIKRKVNKFEETTGHRLLYLTISGSKLYGTNTPDSDIDLKGIFLPRKEELILQSVNNSYTDNTNNSKVKNSKEDIDFSLHSVHNFFNQLYSSETGAVDVLFSMFREDTILYKNEDFIRLMKDNYKSFLNSNMKSFVGYALGQTKKYNIKGRRYKELDVFYNSIITLEGFDKEAKLETAFDTFSEIMEINNFKYIGFTMLSPPKNAKSATKIKYINILGKTFHGNIKLGYFIEMVKVQFNGFGNRTKTIAKTDVDWKSASHAFRIALETKELLETSFIKFPLTYANLVKEVKYGIKDMEYLVTNVEQILDEVEELVIKSKLPLTCDKDVINNLILELYK